MINNNFKWKSYCGYIGLNAENVYAILSKIKKLMQIANILMISTLI